MKTHGRSSEQTFCIEHVSKIWDFGEDDGGVTQKISELMGMTRTSWLIIDNAD
jgi:hypothetical protein